MSTGIVFVKEGRERQTNWLQDGDRHEVQCIPLTPESEAVVVTVTRHNRRQEHYVTVNRVKPEPGSVDFSQTRTTIVEKIRIDNTVRQTFGKRR